MNKIADANAFLDLQSLAALKGKATQSGGRDIDQLRQVASHFESMFIQMLLKNMRATSFDDGGLFNNDYTKFYQNMFDQQISVEATKGMGKGLGIAEMLVRQLSGTPQSAGRMNGQPAGVTRETLFGPQPAQPQTEAQSGAEGMQAANARPTTEPARWSPQSPREFLQDIWPHARRAAATLDVPPEAIMAQAALETGWGKHVMQHADGSSSFNLFGIKADNRWQGGQVVKPTLEFRDGVMQQERAAFRAYDSLAEGFDDYARFLQTNPRYRQALQADTGVEFATGLHRAGYATDPEYSSKIRSIMYRSDFQQQLAALKHDARGPLASAGDPSAGVGSPEALVTTASWREGEV